MVIDWFRNLTIANQVAIIVAGITASGGIIVAIINGIFSACAKKKDDKSSKYLINQTAYNNATQIGIEINNKKEDE